LQVFRAVADSDLLEANVVDSAYEQIIEAHLYKTKYAWKK